MLGRNHAIVGAGVGVAITTADHGPVLFARALESIHPLDQSVPAAVANPVGLFVAYLVGMAMAAVFALVPDLDSPESTLGKALPRWWHRLTPGHRGPTHWALSGLLVGGVAWLCGAVSAGGAPASNLFPHLVLGGYLLGHLACDLPTKDGVPLFGPFVRVNVGLPLFRAGAWFEPAVAYGIALLLIGWSAGVFALVSGGVA